MSTVQEVERVLSQMSRAERAHPVSIVAGNLAEAFAGIESIRGVCGGDAVIVRTRIPVWVLEQARRLGTSEADGL